MSKVLTIDLETTIRNHKDLSEFPIGKDKASPHFPDNEIVMAGHKTGAAYTHTAMHTRSLISWLAPVAYEEGDEIISFLIGQNIKFDLLYLMKEHYDEMTEYLLENYVWDIQLAEYILTGQDAKYASLDGMAKKYGLPLKDDKIKEYWEAGIDTTDIPDEELKKYLINDVDVTYAVFVEQFKQAKELDLLPLMWDQMAALVATTEMEYNGMYFNTHKAEDLADDVREEIADYEISAQLFMKHCGIVMPNPASNKHVGLALFGGTYEYTKKVEATDEFGNVIHYKSGMRKGEVKLKNEKIAENIEGVAAGLGTKTTKGAFKTDTTTLKELSESPTVLPIVQEFIATILTLRTLNKDLSTYYEGYSDLVFPDGCIHGKLSHVGTGTGRLSSQSPNLQNTSHSTGEE